MAALDRFTIADILEPGGPHLRGLSYYSAVGRSIFGSGKRCPLQGS